MFQSSKKEIDIVQLGIVNQAELKLLLRVLYKVEDIATCLVEYVKLWDDWEVDRYGNANLVIKEYLVIVNNRRAFWNLIKDILKITILNTNTPYPSRRYGVSVPELTKDHEGNKPIRRIQKKAIRRISDIVCKDSGRYQS
ncbi:hypothetical protein Tco_0996816 [Tanacetum coccineum]